MYIVMHCYEYCKWTLHYVPISSHPANSTAINIEVDAVPESYSRMFVTGRATILISAVGVLHYLGISSFYQSTCGAGFFAHILSYHIGSNVYVHYYYFIFIMTFIILLFL